MNLKLKLIFFCLILLGAGAILFGGRRFVDVQPADPRPAAREDLAAPAGFTLPDPPVRKVLSSDYHIFQSFNNCAPAALSMALSYYGINLSQERLAEELRPYNNPEGKNDDKSTTPDELAEKAEEHGLLTYFRADGDIDLLKRLIANDFPVVMRTLLYPDKEYAHYRVVKGYDDETREIIQDDSLEGKNLRFSYSEFLKLWQLFNYEYLILVPPDKREIAEAVLGEEADARISWQNALHTAEKELAADPSNVRARFNLSVANYYLGNYAESVEEFEKIEKVLPRITMWYQSEPIRSYAALGNAERVFALTAKILQDGNPAAAELYLLRGEMYLKQGDRTAAKNEFEKAVFYNKNWKAAQTALSSVQ